MKGQGSLKKQANLSTEFWLIPGEFSDLCCLMNTLQIYSSDMPAARRGISVHSLIILIIDLAKPKSRACNFMTIINF